MPEHSILVGDCREWMRKLKPNSIDAVVTDPPYELGFMEKSWDQSGVAFDPETWKLALRVLKPGGHLLAFGGTRTYHRIAVAIEDAGFEIRDSIDWIYGQGFPKSLDVSKAIDKMHGAEREPTGEVKTRHGGGAHSDKIQQLDPNARETPITRAATPEATRFEGWGTALKPAHEPIVVARKPLVGTVAANVLGHGTGAINVDGCRVGTDGGTSRSGQAPYPKREDGREDRSGSWARTGHAIESIAAGRWPPNVLLTHSPGCRHAGTRTVATGTAVQRNGGGQKIGAICYSGTDKDLVRPDATYGENGHEEIPAYECVPGCPVAMMDAQSGELKSGKPSGTRNADSMTFGQVRGNGSTLTGFGDAGGASRFFPTFEWSDFDFRYCAKASTKDRGGKGNIHPTVKPIAIMRWLVRLVTPTGGVVLDPFAGSGTTVIAAIREGFHALGIEQSEEYARIAKVRIEGLTSSI